MNFALTLPWKAFEPHLGPLQAALGDALERYRE
jgi:hypothetical protein